MISTSNSVKLREFIDKQPLGDQFLCADCKRFHLESGSILTICRGHNRFSLREIKWNWLGSKSLLPENLRSEDLILAKYRSQCASVLSKDTM